MRVSYAAVCTGLLSLFLLTPWTSGAAAPRTPIAARVACSSIRVRPATVRQLGLDTTLSFTVSPDGINDEIQVSGSGGFLYQTQMILEMPTEIGPLDAVLELAVPNPGDTNHNAISDFLEVALPLDPVTTDGAFSNDAFKGTVKATWSRDAGAAVGTVKMRVIVPGFGFDMTFQHQFEIYEYIGLLTYDIQGTNILGNVSLKRQGAEGEMKGPLPMYAASVNQLAYRPTTWTNGAAELKMIGSVELDPKDPYYLIRGGGVTNYFGAFFFEDGDPGTPFPDEYDLWAIDLWDSNDSNGNGIPDLTDPAGTPPPTLAIRLENSRPTLTVRGVSGQDVIVEQRSQAGAGAWSTIKTLRLTAASEDIAVDPPTDGRAFWRARSP